MRSFLFSLRIEGHERDLSKWITWSYCVLGWSVVFFFSVVWKWGWGAVKWNSRPGSDIRFWRKACPGSRGGETVGAVLQMDTCTPVLKPHPHSSLHLISWKSTINTIVPLLTTNPQSLPPLYGVRLDQSLLGRKSENCHFEGGNTHTLSLASLGFFLPPCTGMNSLKHITCL